MSIKNLGYSWLDNSFDAMVNNLYWLLHKRCLDFELNYLVLSTLMLR